MCTPWSISSSEAASLTSKSSSSDSSRFALAPRVHHLPLGRDSDSENDVTFCSCSSSPARALRDACFGTTWCEEDDSSLEPEDEDGDKDEDAGELRLELVEDGSRGKRAR